MSYFYYVISCRHTDEDWIHSQWYDEHIIGKVPLDDRAQLRCDEVSVGLQKTDGGICLLTDLVDEGGSYNLSRVATLDIDFHHGNGTQDIFYNRNDVLTVSVHGHPNFAYPYFSGFADEVGHGAGQGFNHNYCLQENAGAETYLATLEKALKQIRKFAPMFFVVSLGFDTMKGDPTGSFGLKPETMKKIGITLASMNLPTLMVQEGGYSLRNLKTGSVALFNGFADVMRQQAKKTLNQESKK